MHNHDTIGQAEQYIQIFTDEEDTDSLLLLLVEDIINIVRSTNIQTAYRISRNQQFWIEIDLATEKNLLNITA